MPRSWWWKILFVVMLIALSIASLVPSIVELGLYPEVPVEDLEADLPRISALFEDTARRIKTADASSEAQVSKEDLSNFSESLNQEVGFYRGEGEVRVKMLEDGSLLAWADDNRNAVFDISPELGKLKLIDLSTRLIGGRNPLPGPEMVFRAWIENGASDKDPNTLVLRDSANNVFRHKLKKRPLEGERMTPLLAKMIRLHSEARDGKSWVMPEKWTPFMLSGSEGTQEETLSTRTPPLPDWYISYAENYTDRTLALGLDLKGGLLLRYSVGLEEAINNKLKSFGDDMEKELGREALTYTILELKGRIVLDFKDSSAKSKLSKALEKFPSIIKIAEDGDKITLSFKEERMKEIKDSILTQAVETIRKRVDQFGLSNPAVRVEGGRHIMVELPGLSKRRAREAERLISNTAVLTFKKTLRPDAEAQLFQQLAERDLPDGVQKRNNGSIEIYADNVYAANGVMVREGKSILRSFVRANSDIIKSASTTEKVEIAYEEILPQLREKKKHPDAKPIWVIRGVFAAKIIGGEHVDDAYQGTDPDTNMPYVSLKLNTQGGSLFHDFTREDDAELRMKHKLDKLAIMMDDTLISDPVINSEIGGGQVSIEMGSGDRVQVMADVQSLIISLHSGALAAPIEQEFKTLIGPSLGHDSIESGMLSLSVGMICVVFFMLFYYKSSGIIANFALLLNLLFILAIMAFMGSTLTLPGIAGIVLTIGMAVDANVIIFERVREELREGETPRKAIQQGYDKAYWTILDANITTGLAAIVLMEFGSGPVQGFAVTLLIGIICSVFTAIFVTRLLFDLWLTRRQVERLSI